MCLWNDLKHSPYISEPTLRHQNTNAFISNKQLQQERLTAILKPQFKEISLSEILHDQKKGLLNISFSGPFPQVPTEIHTITLEIKDHASTQQTASFVSP